MAKVTLKSVYKIYPGERGKEVAAVENFNLEITDREFVVFVGPSGCGKSTTLRMIAGLEEISKGDVLIDDARVNDSLRRIATSRWFSKTTRSTRT